MLADQLKGAGVRLHLENPLISEKPNIITLYYLQKAWTASGRLFNSLAVLRDHSKICVEICERPETCQQYQAPQSATVTSMSLRS